MSLEQKIDDLIASNTQLLLAIDNLAGLIVEKATPETPDKPAPKKSAGKKAAPKKAEKETTETRFFHRESSATLYQTTDPDEIATLEAKDGVEEIDEDTYNELAEKAERRKAQLAELADKKDDAEEDDGLGDDSDGLGDEEITSEQLLAHLKKLKALEGGRAGLASVFKHFGVKAFPEIKEEDYAKAHAKASEVMEELEAA